MKSVKTITGVKEMEHARLRERYIMETEPKYDYLLAEDRKKVVEVVGEIAHRHSLAG